jgi:hypothetical protein
MDTPKTDYWPDDLGSSDIVTPVTILREQAAALGKKTHNIVEARVRSEGGADFVHYLELVVPAMNSYRYLLAQVIHPVELYPLRFLYYPTGVDAQAGDEAEFRKHLRESLSNDKTRQLINVLLAQVQDATPQSA